MARMMRVIPFKDADLEILKEWFTAQEVQRRMEGMLPLEDWYSFAKENDQYYIWMSYTNDQPVGIAMVEAEKNNSGSIGIIVNPVLRKRGFGKELVRQTLLMEELSHVDHWLAGIEEDNIACIRCFESAGFSKEYPQPDEDGFFNLVYDRNKEIPLTM